MKYEAKTFELSGLDGISDDQIAQHRDILYTGYVKKLNEIREKLSTVDLGSANQTYSELRALKAEETFALNGVILHELYFGNLGRDSASPTGELSALIEKDFGSLESYKRELSACGLAARGWVVLGLSLLDSKLHNFCLDSHNSGVPVSTIPILVMDVYEHAYGIDYGVKRPPYIEAFIKNIDWSACEQRLIAAKVSMKL